MRVLLTGASGQLGAYLLHTAPDREVIHCEVMAWSNTKSGTLEGFPLEQVDLTNSAQVAAGFQRAAPDIVLHSAAISRIDRCHRDPALALAVNTNATRQLAQLAADRKARLVYVSTDMVFDGEKGAPYNEADAPAPRSQYGRTKLGGELAVQDVYPLAAIARLSLLVGPGRHGGESFFDVQVRALREGKPLDLFIDEWRTPLDYVTAATALWKLALSDVTGILHLGGPQRLSRYDIGVQLAQLLKADPRWIRGIPQAQAVTPEPRPRDLSFDVSRWRNRFPEIPWRPWTETISELSSW